MTFFISLLVLVLFLWLLGWWFARGEDLTVYDHPVDPPGIETLGGPGSPSPEHRRAEEEIQASIAEVSGKTRRQRLNNVREYMEQIPAGRNFDCEFRPVDADGVPGEWVLAPGSNPSRRVLYLHGGAFIAGSPNSHRTITSRYARELDAAVLAIDYRLMPEHRREQAIADCRTAYRWILDNGPDGPGTAERIVVSGDSAGGNLSLMVAAWARDAALRAPDCVIALSPLTDSTFSSPSIRANVESDTMLGPLFGRLMKIPHVVLTWLYVLENRYRPVNPDVSPLRGDLSRLPPTLIQVSESEMLLDDARRYVNKARAAGSPARLQTWPALVHVWQILNPEVPEANEAFEKIREFIHSVETA